MRTLTLHILQVGNRVLAGMVPLRYNLVDILRPNPDLYGPFWICMTLIFTIAISGNIASLFRYILSTVSSCEHESDSICREREGWEFHFHEVTVVGTAVYTYTWVVPAILWGVLWWRGSRDSYTLLELLSIYGYCIAAFIPVTVSTNILPCVRGEGLITAPSSRSFGSSTVRFCAGSY